MLRPARVAQRFGFGLGGGLVAVRNPPRDAGQPPVGCVAVGRGTGLGTAETAADALASGEDEVAGSLVAGPGAPAALAASAVDVGTVIGFEASSSALARLDRMKSTAAAATIVRIAVAALISVRRRTCSGASGGGISVVVMLALVTCEGGSAPKRALRGEDGAGVRTAPPGDDMDAGP